MKKLILLCALVCASQLYGMELELNPEIWGQAQLPNDVKVVIIMALAQSGNSINEAIKNIVQAKEINKELNATINSLEGFTKIVHMLADKFGKSTEEVANQFNTPIAKGYIRLGINLLTAADNNLISRVTQLITQGADVNFSDSFGFTPLNYAEDYGDNPDVKKRKSEVKEILLKAGARK